MHAAKHALVDEVHLPVGALQGQSHAEVLAIRALRCRQEHLPTHPEVYDQGRSIVQWHPQELAPPADAGDLPAPQRILKIRDSLLVAAHRSGVEDLHRPEDSTCHIGIEASPYNFNLGEFRHRGGER